MKGFSLIEVLIALGLLGLVSGALLSALLSLDLQRERIRERDLASAAAQARLDLLRTDGDFRTLYARLKNSPNFDVPGLRGTQVGTVLVPPTLGENLNAPSFGLPQDLNLDGRTDSVDHASDYRLLPVRIRIEWDGATGRRNYELFTVLHARR